jgi:uncharacterized protein
VIEFPKAKQKRLMLPGANGLLEAICKTPDNVNDHAVVLICHPHPLYQGSMDNKVVTTLARAFSDLGYRTCRFNFRGVGKSDGQYDKGEGETEDALCLSNWLKDCFPDAALWLAGFSFGSYIAARVADQQNVKRLVTVGPAVEHFDFVPLHIQCPWLILQGEADEVVSSALVRQFVAKTNAQVDFVQFPGVGHFFHGQLNALREAVVKGCSNDS